MDIDTLYLPIAVAWAVTLLLAAWFGWRAGRKNVAPDVPDGAYRENIAFDLTVMQSKVSAIIDAANEINKLAAKGKANLGTVTFSAGQAAGGFELAPLTRE